MNKTFEKKGWEIFEAINFVRTVESIAKKFGLHVGLAGSVLHKGNSIDDLDLVVFPLQTKKGFNFRGFQEALEEIGLFDWFCRTPYHEGDAKLVYATYYNYKQRVDWFVFHVDMEDIRAEHKKI